MLLLLLLMLLVLLLLLLLIKACNDLLKYVYMSSSSRFQDLQPIGWRDHIKLEPWSMSQIE